MLKPIFRGPLACCFSLSIILPGGPLRAAVSTPVGTLRSEGAVFLGKGPVSGDTVVYCGDVLATDTGRATVAFSRGALMVLSSHSGAAFSGSPDGFLIGLEKGHFALAGSDRQPARVEASGLVFTPIGASPGLADISLEDDGSMTIAVNRGALSVANLRPGAVVVNAGQTLTVSPRLAQSQGDPVGTGAHGKKTLDEKLRTFRIGGLSHTASVAIVAVGIGAAATAAIVIPYSIQQTGVSPSTPY